MNKENNFIGNAQSKFQPYLKNPGVTTNNTNNNFTLNQIDNSNSNNNYVANQHNDNNIFFSFEISQQQQEQQYQQHQSEALLQDYQNFQAGHFQPLKENRNFNTNQNNSMNDNVFQRNNQMLQKPLQIYQNLNQQNSCPMPIQQTQLQQNKNLVSVKESGLNQFFTGFTHFNEVQSQCLQNILNSNQNMIVSAPTASGKTVLFELAIIRHIKNYQQPFNFTIIYLAPIKALCQEKMREWQAKFGHILNVMELTGDTPQTDDNENQQQHNDNKLFKNHDNAKLNNINNNFDNQKVNYYEPGAQELQYLNANIIITTPEKLDSVTRKTGPHALTQKISLLLIDEVHLLNTEERGATLEAVVSRLKLMKISAQNKNNASKQFAQQNEQNGIGNLRILAVSATIPNIHDIAQWLECDQKTGGIRIFGSEFRKVQLEKHVLGFKMAKNEYMFEVNLNYKILDVIRKYSDKKPTLVFCQTQNGTAACCEELIKRAGAREFTCASNDEGRKLQMVAATLQDKKLQRMVPFGIAFHNANLDLSDRRKIEELFISQDILILATTSTLAQGVNLPARLVIIKSTFCYRGQGKGYTQYTSLEVEQMCGRAGRPQFDTKGVVVIMTDLKNVDLYQNFNVQQQGTVLESQLANMVLEHFNSEVALGSISTFDQSVNYVKSSFFYIRLLKNPAYYFKDKKNFNLNQIDQFVDELCRNTLNKLASLCMVNMNVPCTIQEQDNQKQDNSIQPFGNNRNNKEHKILQRIQTKELGKDVSRFFVSIQTIENIHNYFLNNTESLPSSDEKEHKQLQLMQNQQHNQETEEFQNENENSKSVDIRTLNKPNLKNQKGQADPIQELLHILSFAKEFEQMRSKMEERKDLTALSKQVRYQLSGAVTTAQKKVYVLLQCIIGNSTAQIEQWELKRCVNEVKQHVWRIMLCFQKFFTYSYINGRYLHACIKLSNMINQNTWDDCDHTLLRQIPGVGEKLSQMLIAHQLFSLQKLKDASAGQIETACNKTHPFGVNLKKFIDSLPKLFVASKIEPNKIILQLSPMAQLAGNDTAAAASNSNIRFFIPKLSFSYNMHLLVLNNDKRQTILLQKLIYLSKMDPSNLSLSYEIKTSTNKCIFPLKIHLIADRFVGIDDSYNMQRNGQLTQLFGEQTKLDSFLVSSNNQMAKQQKKEKLQSKKNSVASTTVLKERQDQSCQGDALFGESFGKTHKRSQSCDNAIAEIDLQMIDEILRTHNAKEQENQQQAKRENQKINKFNVIEGNIASYLDPFEKEKEKQQTIVNKQKLQPLLKNTNQEQTQINNRSININVNQQSNQHVAQERNQKNTLNLSQFTFKKPVQSRQPTAQITNDVSNSGNQIQSIENFQKFQNNKFLPMPQPPQGPSMFQFGNKQKEDNVDNQIQRPWQNIKSIIPQGDNGSVLLNISNILSCGNENQHGNKVNDFFAQNGTADKINRNQFADHKSNIFQKIFFGGPNQNIMNNNHKN